jgi:hypothetical protein
MRLWNQSGGNQWFPNVGIAISVKKFAKLMPSKEKSGDAALKEKR